MHVSAFANISSGSCSHHLKRKEVEVAVAWGVSAVADAERRGR
jgi:hypothetical protein